MSLTALLRRIAGKASLDWRDHARDAYELLTFELREQRLTPQQSARLQRAVADVVRCDLLIRRIEATGLNEPTERLQLLKRDALNALGTLRLIKRIDVQSRIAVLSEQAVDRLEAAAWKTGLTLADVLL